MREEPNHHKPPLRKLCNRRRKFATGVAFLWLLSVSPDKAPDRPSDKRKRTKKSGGVRIRTWNLVDSNLESPRGTQALRGRGPGTGHKEGGQLAPPTLVPPAWGVPAWRGWAHCGALWCFPHCFSSSALRLAISASLPAITVFARASSSSRSVRRQPRRDLRLDQLAQLLLRERARAH